ncbi:hypothetical protein ACER0A_011410 [Haloimpatiens sp. FM7315]|uniref:hypothetical protein n=1 Tax=Haloimpatiens sp. FM7315 TaxID=3298609 RepID=UPI0039774CF7
MLNIKYPLTILLSDNLGYILVFNNKTLVYSIQLVLNSIYFICTILLLKYKKRARKLMFFSCIIAAIGLFEVLIGFNCEILISNIFITDFLWLILGDYILFKLRNRAEI